MRQRIWAHAFDSPGSPWWHESCKNVWGKTSGMERNMTSIRIVAAALVACFAGAPALAQGTKVAIGISGWTGFAPLTLAKEAGIFAKNGLDVTIKKIPAGEPASRHRLRRHPVRRHHGRDLDRVERQRRRHHAAVSAGQVLWRRRHGRAQQRRRDQGREGQDGCGLGARHRALFHARLVPQEERPHGEGRDRRQHGAGGRRRKPSSPGRTTSP